MTETTEHPGALRSLITRKPYSCDGCGEQRHVSPLGRLFDPWHNRYTRTGSGRYQAVPCGTYRRVRARG